MTHFTRRCVLAGAGAIVAAQQFPGRALAQGNTIRFIVGAAAGGAIEVYARIIGEHMSKTLGKSIIIESRPGAGGTIATQWVKDQPADGATVWIGTMSMTEINPHVFSKIKWKVSDFTPILKGIDAPLAFVTHPSVPAKTLDEFIAWVKKNPGKLSFASYSAGTPSHFLGLVMNQKFGLDMQHVPYRGSGPLTNDLIAGHALFGFNQIPNAKPQVDSGKLRALATTGETRSFLLPDTPTFTELGHPEFNVSVWFGLLVRKETPKPIIDAYLAAARAAHADAKVQAALRAQGLQPSGLETEAFAAEIAKGSARWEKVIKAAGFKVN